LTQRNGGQILVDQLRLHGVDAAYTVPGESFLPVLDALYEARDEIRLISARHEGGAANMAEAHAKLTGTPSVCFVNRGPGAAHAANGVHTAFQDSTPMIVFIGQGPRGFLDRESFQEMDYSIFFSEMTKWAGQIEDVDRIPEMISKAMHISMEGRPGPVAIALPEDVMQAKTAASDGRPYRIARPHPGDADMAELRAMLAEAERPVMVVGGGGWSAAASRDLLAFAEANRIPTAASFRCQDYIDNYSDVFFGYGGLGIRPKLAQRITDADLLLVVGARMGEATTNRYALVDIPNPSQRMVHVHLGPEELGSVYRADLPINAGYEEFAAAASRLDPVEHIRWDAWAHAARTDYLDDLAPPDAPGELNLATVVRHVSETLPANAIITNGAGNFTVWAHRYYQFSSYRTQLGPTSGSMAYGIPAAVAAKVVHPDRPVVAWTGDGDAMMSFQEIATAIQYDLDPVILLVNNGMLGTMRMHQERRFPGRVHGTDLVNPDFQMLARSFGLHTEFVERDGDFPAAFDRALGSSRASLVELRLDPEQLTPGKTLSGTREAAIDQARRRDV
jgi:acetolactate synthase-1/2/3 large subunit